jgi:hypothetical protein
VEPDDLAVSVLEEIVIAVIVVIATVIVDLYLTKGWPFHRSAEPRL